MNACLFSCKTKPFFLYIHLNYTYSLNYDTRLIVFILSKFEKKIKKSHSSVFDGGPTGRNPH